MKTIKRFVFLCRDWNTRKFYFCKNLWVVVDERPLQYLGTEIQKYYFKEKQDAIDFIETYN